MSRDELYQTLRSSFERHAAEQARAALAWVISGMAAPFEPQPVAEFVRLAATRPTALTDGHFDRLREAGLSDEAIFELVSAASVGVGLARRDRALALLRKEGSA